MEEKEKLIQSLRDLADKIESTDNYYAYDRYVFIGLYVYCMKTLDKYRKKKNLVIEDGCINL
jgi:hypothetical protein